MKNLLYPILLLLLPFVVNGQLIDENPTDTITAQSLPEPVIDTIPEINIFEDNDPLKITLTYDISSFIKNKRKEEYSDAIFQIHYNDTQLITKNIRLRARGNFRKDECIFPPVFLNFKTDPLENSELKGIKKVKMVTHCTTSKASQNYVLKEFLAYKFYNILTDNSFRVRLLNIEYVDTGKKKKNYRRYGFLIEPQELLARRTNAIEINPEIIFGTNILDKDADRVALFQYMIGNTDWRFKGGHNMKYIKSLDQLTDKVIPVPYDFDFSGLVDTYYSIPQPWTGIKDVTEREYTGYYRDMDKKYMDIINEFIDKKDEILKTIEAFQYLNDKEKGFVENYIQSFFTEIEKPERFIINLKYQCRSADF